MKAQRKEQHREQHKEQPKEQPKETDRELIPPYIVAKAKRLWDRMVFEITLMTDRMNWMVASQEFLFGAFFVGLDAKKDSPVVNFVVALTVIGIVLSATMFVFTFTAFHNMTLCRNEIRKIKLAYPEYLLDEVDKSHLIKSLRNSVIVSTYLVIGVFLVFWILAFRAALRK